MDQSQVPEQDVFQMAYRFGWMDKAGRKESQGKRLADGVIEQYDGSSRRFYWLLVAWYKAGYLIALLIGLSVTSHSCS